MMLSIGTRISALSRLCICESGPTRGRGTTRDGKFVARPTSGVYVGLQDKEPTLGPLKRMALVNDPRVDAFPFHPDFAFLRGDPRLNELRRKRHLLLLQ
jgi:hypothetical protein